MRKLRLLSMAAVLTLTLGVPAFAGITDTPPAPAPPPPSAPGIIETPPQVIDLALVLLRLLTD
jgi:hypothetical protein